MAGAPRYDPRMATNRRSAAIAFTVFARVVLPSAAFAQDPVADLRKELAALRAEVEQLRAEVAGLKSDASAQPSPSQKLEMLEAQVGQLAQTKVESMSRVPVRLFGTVHAGVFANSATANWLDNPNLVLPPPADGHLGTMSASLRQSRIGLAVDAPSIGAFRTNAVVAFDFFGGIPGFQTGQAMGLPRLLLAYARVEGTRTQVEVGQDHMILAPRDPSSVAAFAFPLLFRSGNLYLRTPQARVEFAIAPRLHAAGGIVAPIGGDITGTDYVFVPPALGGERSRRPGFQARVAYTSGEADAPRLVDVGVSGHIGWERPGSELRRSWAGAIDFAARRDRLGVAGELFTGDNIDAFGGATGINARAGGGWAEVQLFPSQRVTAAAGFGIDDLTDDRRTLLPRQQNRSAYGSITYALTSELRASFEYRRLRTVAGNRARSNDHFDWVLVHTF